MPNLHPDKLVGVARAVQQRPRRPKPSVENAAVAAASAPKPLTPRSQGPKGGDDGLIESLAYRMRDEHWNGFLDRIARGGVGEARKAKGQGQIKAPKPAVGNTKGQPIVISIQAPPNA